MGSRGVRVQQCARMEGRHPGIRTNNMYKTNMLEGTGVSTGVSNTASAGGGGGGGGGGDRGGALQPGQVSYPPHRKQGRVLR